MRPKMEFWLKEEGSLFYPNRVVDSTRPASRKLKRASLTTAWPTIPAEANPEHSTGHGGDYTRQRLPLKLIHSEEHADKTSAEKRESQIKRWTYRKKLALVEGNLDLLKKL